MKLEYFQHFFEKIIKYRISLKSVQWEPSCSMRTDGQTGTYKANGDNLKRMDERYIGIKYNK